MDLLGPGINPLGTTAYTEFSTKQLNLIKTGDYSEVVENTNAVASKW